MIPLIDYLRECGEGAATPGNTTGIGNPMAPSGDQVGSGDIPNATAKTKRKRNKKDVRIKDGKEYEHMPVTYEDLMEGLFDDDPVERYVNDIKSASKLLWFIKTVAENKSYLAASSSEPIIYDAYNLDYRKVYAAKNEFMRVVKKLGCDKEYAKEQFDDNQLLIIYKDDDNGWHSKGFTMYAVVKGRNNLLYKSFGSIITTRDGGRCSSSITKANFNSSIYKWFNDDIWGWGYEYIVLPVTYWKQCFSAEELKKLGL